MGVSAQRKKMQVERRREQAYQEANEKGPQRTDEKNTKPQPPPRLAPAPSCADAPDVCPCVNAVVGKDEGLEER